MRSVYRIKHTMQADLYVIEYFCHPLIVTWQCDLEIVSANEKWE